MLLTKCTILELNYIDMDIYKIEVQEKCSSKLLIRIKMQSLNWESFSSIMNSK